MFEKTRNACSFPVKNKITRTSSIRGNELIIYKGIDDEIWACLKRKFSQAETTKLK